MATILFPTPLSAQDIRRYDPFRGFHFGYTASVGVTRPCDVFPNIGDYPSPEGLPGCGYLAGIEASYHFADFFGVSVGLEYGDTWRQKVRIQYPLGGQKFVFSDHYSSLYFPVKFEMHLPVGDRFHLFSDLGVRLGTVGFFIEMGRLYGQHFENAEQALVRTDEAGNGEDMVFSMAYDLLPNSVTADLLFDFGFYYRLPYDDLLRFAVGANVGLVRFSQGWYYFPDEEAAGTVSTTNTHFDIQVAYIHNFKKTKEKLYQKPRWDKDLPRHELMLSLSDPSPLSILFSGLSKSALPTLSLSYHYRVAKWCWIGGSLGHTHLRSHTMPERNDEHFNLLAELRFSYLNRKHVTLYSGFGLGIGFMVGHPYKQIDLATYEERVPHYHYSSLQLTAIGVSAGAEHWFGTAELGFGARGFATLGVGYAF
ncbi:MAG: hypothetical protein J6T13_01715 [Bacteroidales bacterium]|nr:hypothetical protein [Bacteroidales bacterium]